MGSLLLQVGWEWDFDQFVYTEEYLKPREQCPAGTRTRPATRYFFWYPTRPDSVLESSGYGVTRNIGYYLIFRVNPKFRVLPDINVLSQTETEEKKHWEWLSDLVTKSHIWVFLTNCENVIVTLRVSEWQWESDLGGTCNSCDVYENEDNCRMIIMMIIMTKMAIYCPQGSGTLRQQLLMMHWLCQSMPEYARVLSSFAFI